jgi:hypothetical protein
LNYNGFHVLSATPRDMKCDMKQLPDDTNIVSIRKMNHGLR